MRRLLHVTALAIAVPLLAALPAAADAVKWNETATIKHQHVMRYHVTSITVGAKSWTAQISFQNTSKKTLKVGTEFALAFYGNKHDEALNKAVALAQTTAVSSQLPKTLKPGQSWTGTIGGNGKLTQTSTLYVRVIFGPFTGLPGETKSVVWITDHALTLGLPAGSGNVA